MCFKRSVDLLLFTFTEVWVIKDPSFSVMNQGSRYESRTCLNFFSANVWVTMHRLERFLILITSFYWTQQIWISEKSSLLLSVEEVTNMKDLATVMILQRRLNSIQRDVGPLEDKVLCIPLLKILSKNPLRPCSIKSWPRLYKWTPPSSLWDKRSNGFSFSNLKVCSMAMWAAILWLSLTFSIFQ